MSTKVQVPADFKGEVLLPNSSVTLKANQTTDLPDELFKSADVQLALKEGFLVVVKNNKAKPKSKAPAEPKVQRRRRTKKKTETVEEPAEEPQEVAVPNEPDTQMATWDPAKKRMINKDQSGRKTMKNLNATQAPVPEATSDDVQVGEVDFTDRPAKKAAKKKPAKKSQKKLRSAGKNTAMKKAAKGVADVVKKTKGLKPVGTRREEPTAGPKDLAFVDHEQEAERIRRHPKLRQTNEEVE